MPLPWVPRELLDKSDFEYPVGWRVLTLCGGVSGHLQGGAVFVLGENFDRPVSFG